MEIQDQLGNTLQFLGPPQRIVSLVPSQTELIVDLGLEKQLCGITKFCVHPKTLRNDKTIVGGTKTVNYEKITALSPDIILCNKEENTKEIVATLSLNYRVHVSDVQTLDDALSLIQDYGHIFSCEARAALISTKIQSEIKAFSHFTSTLSSLRVIYCIWQNPWMTVGSDTFIHHLLAQNKFQNVYEHALRYPEVSDVDFQRLSLDLVLLSSEPFPFQEKHIPAAQRLQPHAKIVLVDGEYFSWYGSRLTKAFAYFSTLRSQL